MVRKNIIQVSVCFIFCLAACQAAPAQTPQNPEPLPTASALSPATPVPATIPVVATLTPAPSPTAEPKKPVNIRAICTLIGQPATTTVAEGTPINIIWGWGAKTEAQVNDFMENNLTEVKLDGNLLVGKISGGIQENPARGEMEVVWYADVGVLTAGQHTITYDVRFKKVIDDGTSQYGPGTKNPNEHDQCQIIVGTDPANQPTQAALNSPRDGMQMVEVPAGAFSMGSEVFDVEKPIHSVVLPAFRIDRTEVTNTMFAKFVQEQNYKTDVEKAGQSIYFSLSENKWITAAGTDWQHPQGPGSSLAGLEQHPVVHVSWNDASAYCAWAGRRLPGEAEWEKAARGTDGRTYPWGENAPNGTLLNFTGVFAAERDKPGYLFTRPVGGYPGGASPYGALDMAGNVWEWVAEWFNAYPGNTVADVHYGTIYRVLRGGSWFNQPINLRSAYRYIGKPSGAASNIGFRCAASDAGNS